VQVASAAPPELAEAPAARATPVPSAPVSRGSVIAAATAALPPPQPKPEPAPLTSGVIETQAMAAIPGSSEPMKPVRVRTVLVKAGQIKLASAASSQAAPPVTNTIAPARQDAAETPSSAASYAEATRTEMPPQPAGHGTGHGLLGVLPASSVPPSMQAPTQASTQALALADPTPQVQPESQMIQQNGAIKPVAAHTGWIIQVGALESESEAQQRLDAARNQAHGMLGKADPFTEPVVAKGEKKLFRARFAGLDRDQAEAVCKTLKHSDISCITIKN
jgi:D-alanyl-D-alanine carboxypeptidase